jgi:hypothetical protein
LPLALFDHVDLVVSSSERGETIHYGRGESILAQADRPGD